MAKILDWLEELGMSEYAQRFAENGVSVLPHLTDHDLKDIGVLLGHRRIMLAAISQLSGGPQSFPEPAGPVVQLQKEARVALATPASLSPCDEAG
jgi:hypothetical protein